MDEQSEALTAARVMALRREMWDVDGELEELCKEWRAVPRHLREAAEGAKGFAESSRAALTALLRALQYEERPLEEKVRTLEDALDRLEHPEPPAEREFTEVPHEATR